MAVKQVYVGERQEAEPAKLITYHANLKEMYAVHAEALRGGSQALNVRTQIDLPKYFRLRDGKRHSIRLVTIWPEGWKDAKEIAHA